MHKILRTYPSCESVLSLLYRYFKVFPRHADRLVKRKVFPCPAKKLSVDSIDARIIERDLPDQQRFGALQFVGRDRFVPHQAEVLLDDLAHFRDVGRIAGILDTEGYAGLPRLQEGPNRIDP